MSFQAQDFQVRGPPLRGRARDPANIMPGGNGWRRPRRRSAQSAAHVVGAQFVTFRRCAQLTHTVESAWSIQALVAGAPHDEQYDARAARTDGYGAEWSHDDRRRCCRLYHVLMLHLHLACLHAERWLIMVLVYTEGVGPALSREPAGSTRARWFTCAIRILACAQCCRCLRDPFCQWRWWLRSTVNSAHHESH